ncbi:MAG TPA: DUF2069 domain-containing protein [Burkholderiales bacterium]|nr:DUF2069 domain-containing protein [Burkholderiales bacterium]
MKDRLANIKLWHYGAVGSLLALIALCLAWEIWLAPSMLGAWWLMFKVFPLLTPLFGLLHRKRRTFQWSSFLSLAYFVEGVVRAWSETGVSQQLALIEIALSLAWFACAILAARALGPPRVKKVKVRAAD